uniref:DRIM domain-containing protein n=1 Tax=Strongyloides venezuelensis TaxID=75913 RepID=A0A0K0G4H3_STRVS
MTRSLVDISSLTTLSNSRCLLNTDELIAVKYLLKKLIRECCNKNLERAVKLFLTTTKKVPLHQLMTSMGQVVASGNIMDDLSCAEDMFVVCLTSQKVKTISYNVFLNLIKTLLRFLSDQIRTLMVQLERPCKERI